MSIFSNGCWFAMISNATTNTQVFIYFLNRMIEWLIKNNKFGFKNINLILDNCPYNKSKEAIKNMQKLPIKIYFLPPYSPSLAPIELMFGWIKIIINKRSIGMKINLKSKEANNQIFKVFKDINNELTRKMFSKFYKELKANLHINW